MLLALDKERRGVILAFQKRIRSRVLAKEHVFLMFCVVMLTSYVLFLPSARALQVPFIPTDDSGNFKSTFLLHENVYITGGDCKGYSEVTIYVIPNHEEIKPENAVSEPVDAETIDWYSIKSLPTTLIWSAPLTPGEYDIWIDTNQNGQFDPGPDGYRIFCSSPYILVIPEYLIGAIGAMIAMFAALALFHKKRARGVRIIHGRI